MSAPSYDKKTVLVTGGAGFIGSHLCEALVKRAQVICVDNFSTGTPAHLQNLLQNPNFELLRHDINEPIDLEGQRELDRFHVRVHGIQEIYHLACPVAEQSFEQYRLATMQTNSTGWRNILELAAQYKTRVLFASSSSLYETTSEPYVSEDARCWNDHLLPRAAYEESLRFAETMLHTYADIHRFPAKIVRVFQTYGPRMKANEGHLLPDLIQAALAQEDKEIPDSEDARFSLCHVTDLVDGLVKTMDHDMDFRVINIGSDQEVRLGALVELVSRMTGTSARFRFRPQGEHVRVSLPNIHKARQLLHWLPLMRLEDGLKGMIDYVRSTHHSASTFG